MIGPLSNVITAQKVFSMAESVASLAPKPEPENDRNVYVFYLTWLKASAAS